MKTDWKVGEPNVEQQACDHHWWCSDHGEIARCKLCDVETVAWIMWQSAAIHQRLGAVAGGTSAPLLLTIKGLREELAAARKEIDRLQVELQASKDINEKLKLAIDMAFFRRGSLPPLIRHQSEPIVEPLISTYEELGINPGDTFAFKKPASESP